MCSSDEKIKRNKDIYKCQDVALIIPTKDRPKKLMNLLESLGQQSISCGRVITVDGGKSVEELIISYRDVLPVEYYRCVPPGQIRQRNMGISKLDDRTRLVGFLDDDLVMEQDALEKMIDFWNRVEANTAGVGFNIVNSPLLPFSRLMRLLLMSSPAKGRVLPSGRNTAISNLTADIRTEWLGGGYSVWKREILEEFPQENLNTRWATGEDLRFSYPIGKRYPLFVCAGAKVRHEHVYDQAPTENVYQYRGRKESLAVCYFVESHRELSRVACLWMLAGTAFARLVYGYAKFLPEKLEYAQGQVEAIFIYLKSLLGYTDLRSELEG